MPSDSMNIQEQGFRSRMFGGFDKNDVLAYMNTLANEAQQHELEYQEKLRQLQAQLDDLRSQRSDAEARVEALKTELAAANQRADLAESKRHESDEQLQKAQSVAESVQSEHREIQKNANIWQLKCHDLQQQNETLTQQLAAARQLNAAPAPTPDVVREAKLEAQKILADAKLYAESAEKELKQQADTQKSRMAENARGIASGVMLVRDRLARVDQRLSAATLDLDNLTLAIYQALDETAIVPRAPRRRIFPWSRCPRKVRPLHRLCRSLYPRLPSLRSSLSPRPHRPSRRSSGSRQRRTVRPPSRYAACAA